MTNETKKTEEVQNGERAPRETATAYNGHRRPVDESISISDSKILPGELAEGCVLAYDESTKMTGVVFEDDYFYPTVPLNGHRARNLAEAVFKIRSAGEWTLGRKVVTQARVIQELPGFDRYNQDFVDSFTGSVAVFVVYDSPGYGCHVRITQL